MRTREVMREPIIGGTLAQQTLDFDKSFQHVAVEGVGAFAPIASGRPDKWIGREVALIGDEQPMPGIAETYSRATGQEIDYYQVQPY